MNRTGCITAAFVLTLARLAHAEDPPTDPAWTEQSEWGWLLIGSSLALGAALTAAGLAVECHEQHDCRVEQSQYIWGGIGLASTGSMFGFVILENARDFESRNAAQAGGYTLALKGSF